MNLEQPVASPWVEADKLTLVDFDHTLFAANSTELFIAECRPSLIVAVLDGLIRQCIPWRILAGPRGYRVRDYACVAAILILAPWNVWLWRRKAPRLFQEKGSARVLDMLDGVDPHRIAIISFGMRFVIHALLQGGRLADVRLVATPRRPDFGRLRQGKVDIARAEFGPEAVAAATFVTDSEDDRDLLDACASGILVEPQGPPNRARQRLYLPFRYSIEVKYALVFVLDQWLFVDAAVCALAMGHGLLGLMQSALIAPLAMASFMCVYELGYFDNDMVAAAREAKPVLSGREGAYRDYPIKVNSWIWALLLTAAAFGLAFWLGRLDAAGALRAGALWIGLLLVSQLLFRVYNRLPTEQRVYMYPILQISKYCSLLLIFPPTFFGAILVVVHIVNMWVNYLIYRFGGDNLKLNKEMFRLMLFLVGSGGLALSGSMAGLFKAPGADVAHVNEIVAFGAIIAWSALRVARRAGRQWIRKNQAVS